MNNIHESCILCNDTKEALLDFPDNYFDSIITDPPAGISFMNKKWDDDKGGRDHWIKWLSDIFIEAKRTLKPGGHALVWSLPRTSHWTGMALEDAGFEVRDIVHHIFGSGFPKSLNIGKAVDLLQGNIRKVVGIDSNAERFKDYKEQDGCERKTFNDKITKGTSAWEGYGSALKPAVECWWLVRKPISENTIAENVLKWGVGGINIDGCRVPFENKNNYETLVDNYKGGLERATPETKENWTLHGGGWKLGKGIEIPDETKCRFPANLIHDGSDEVLAEFAKAGVSKSSPVGFKGVAWNHSGNTKDERTKLDYQQEYTDVGSPARFFYCAKPSRAERDRGLEDIEGKIPQRYGEMKGTPHHAPNKQNLQKNNHPTVKAQALMKYLIKMITPPGGIVLDMFAGSGSTLVAAKELGHPYIGIEIDPAYCEIAVNRIACIKELVMK